MLKEIFDEHAQVFEEARETLLPELQDAAELAESCLAAGNRLLVFGNGGSAADAQHFAAELVGRFERDRRPLPAIALTVDTSLLTAVGNDHGFEQIFAVDHHPAADDRPGRCRDQPEDRHSRHRLAGAGFAHDAQRFTRQ